MSREEYLGATSDQRFMADVLNGVGGTLFVVCDTVVGEGKSLEATVREFKLKIPDVTDVKLPALRWYVDLLKRYHGITEGPTGAALGANFAPYSAAQSLSGDMHLRQALFTATENPDAITPAQVLALQEFVYAIGEALGQRGE
jgi:hypothetical protein